MSPSCRTRLLLRVGAVFAATGLLLGGCTVPAKVRDALAPKPATSASVAPQTPPPNTNGLDRFYAQQLSWSPCDGGQCARLTVPLDYADPSGQSIELALLKVPARSPGARIGSLVVNPGGPGGSGVDYAKAADFIVGAEVRRRFDIVGFDPRGVDRSEPVRCLDDAGMDAFLGTDPTPDDPAEEKVWDAKSSSFAQACGTQAGPLLPHVSTEDAARDMDILRSRLGEERLHYLGKSYGTYLGAVYAGLFPRNVGRFVLDGVVAPDLTSAEINLGQAQGFELATRTWAGACVAEAHCPLGGSVEEVMTRLRAFLLDVDAHPLPVHGDARVTELTEGWASMGIAVAMYDQGMWATLEDAMAQALRGDGSDLMGLANRYADRSPGGTYSTNLMQAIYAVNCLDLPEPASLSEHEQLAAVAAKVAPTWGRYLAWSSLPCAHWTVKPEGDGVRRTISAQGSGPIVVVGTTRDPATPYEWAVRLRKQLSNAALITYDGDGHTAYTRSNSCVDSAIDAYFVQGTVPPDGLRC